MLFKIIDKNYYRLILDNKNIENINFYNNVELKKFIVKFLPKYLKTYNITGILKLDIYWNIFLGLIINIKKEKEIKNNNFVELKITFHFNNIILYKVNYFDLIENTNIRNQKLIYLDNYYYLNIINDIDADDFIKLLDLSEIIFDEDKKILNNGIKLYI